VRVTGSGAVVGTVVGAAVGVAAGVQAARLKMMIVTRLKSVVLDLWVYMRLLLGRYRGKRKWSKQSPGRAENHLLS
jgi:hypothetical protein